MHNGLRRIVIVAVFVAALCVGGVSSAMAQSFSGGVSAQAVTPGPLPGVYGLERPLVQSSGDEGWARAYGDYVVFQDISVAGDVYLYDRRTNATTTIAALPSSMQVAPSIYGNRVVWMDDRSGNWDIWWYDIAKKTSKRLTSGTAHEMYPVISGDRVAWMDLRNGNWDIYSYDFASGATRRVTTNVADQMYPAISGGRIAWTDSRAGNFDIWWYDVATSTEHQLTSAATAEQNVTLSGTRAAWSSYNGANYEVFITPYFDATTAGPVTFSGTGGDNTSPQLSGDTLVWTHTVAGNDDVWLFHLGSFGVYPITTDANRQTVPAISGNTIVWNDERNGTTDLWGLKFERPTLTVSAPSVVSYGAKTTVTGYLKDTAGKPLPGRTVALQWVRTTDQPTALMWTTAPNVIKTNSAGKFTASLVGPPTAYKVRAYFDGSTDWFKQTSSSVTVKPKAYVGKPSGPTSVGRNTAFTSTGMLKPQHTAGAQIVKIQCYRKVSGVWRLKKTYTAGTEDYLSDSRYIKTGIVLGTKGSWRIRAYYPERATNAKAYSSYRYITAR